MRLSALLTVLTVCLPTVCSAASATFVSPDESHAARILPSPAADGSDAVKRDLEELHAIEKTRTPADIERAQADSAEEDIFVFKTVMGDSFNATSLPLTAQLSAHVKSDESPNAGAAKTEFHRVRPYNLDKTLHPVCKTKTKDDSYPSGHATAGYLEALTLIEIAPAKRDAILARADDYARSRLVCGVHYRSDIEASKLLAYAVHALMSEKPAYREELAAAKAEFERVSAAGK